MREIDTHKVNGCNESLSIVVTDEPGAGGANHHYLMMLPHHRKAWEDEKAGVHAAGLLTENVGPVANCCSLRFQNGPIKDAGTNGITHEALLAVVIDRLQSFQKGPFACRENAIALTKIEEAMHWLQHRTKARVARGVEGTHEK